MTINNKTLEKIATLLFVISTILLSLYLDTKNDLEDCEKWKMRAYNLLDQEKKDQLNKEFENEQMMLENEATIKEKSHN